MKLAPRQQEAVGQATRRLNVFDGSIRAGKTIASELAFLADVLEGPPGLLAMVGRTEKTLRNNVLHPLSEMLPDAALHIAAGSSEAHIFGRKVILLGAADERAESKIRGLTLSGLYGDQIETWPESTFRMAISRLSVDGSRFHGTSNPEGPRHWFKTAFIDRTAELDMSYAHFRLDDNPFVSQSVKDALRAEFPGVWGKRFIDGLWVAAEGAIFDMLDVDRHVVGRPSCVVSHLPKIVAHYLGCDYGTANPFVVWDIGLGIDDRLYVLREYRWDSRKTHVQKTDAQYSEAVRQWLRANRLWDQFGPTYDRWSIDRSAASFVLQAWQDGYPNVSRSRDIPVKDGIRYVSSLLAADRLLFGPEMEGTDGLDEMLGYVWDPVAQEKGIDQPLKLNDHGCDAGRYGITGCTEVWRDWIAADVEDVA